MKLFFRRSSTAIFIIVVLILVFIADLYTTVNFYEQFGLYSKKALISTKWYSFVTYWIVSGDLINLFYYSTMIFLSSVIIEQRMPTSAFRTLILSSILLGGGLYFIFCAYNPPMIGAGFIVKALDGALIAIWLKAKSDFKRWENIYTLISIVSFLNSIIFKESIFYLMNYIALSMFVLGFCFIIILSKYYKIESKEGYNLRLHSDRKGRATTAFSE